MTIPFHLYKLITGETIIAEFHGQDVINEKLNTQAYIIGFPMLINKHEELSHHWIPALPAVMCNRIPLLISHVIVGVEENAISGYILTEYRELVEPLKRIHGL